MPVVNTSGFSVQERPRVDYQDARMLTPAYGALGANIGQGLGLYSQFQQIADEAQARPTRQQMIQIQLQDAQNRLAQAPLEQQLRMAQIAEAQQNAAVPREIVDEVSVTGGDRRLAPVNPNATFEDFQITEDFSPRVRRTSGTRVGGGGVMTPFTKDETLETPAQIRMAERKLDAEIANKGSLASYRNLMGSAAEMNAETRALAQQNARLKIAQGTVIARGADPVTGRLIVTIRNPDGTRESIDTFTDPIAPVPAQVQILREFMGEDGGAPKAGRGAPKASKPTFSTEAEAAAAAAMGFIKPNDDIIVGGREATWQ